MGVRIHETGNVKHDRGAPEGSRLPRGARYAQFLHRGGGWATLGAFDLVPLDACRECPWVDGFRGSTRFVEAFRLGVAVVGQQPEHAAPESALSPFTTASLLLPHPSRIRTCAFLEQFEPLISKSDAYPEPVEGSTHARQRRFRHMGRNRPLRTRHAMRSVVSVSACGRTPEEPCNGPEGKCDNSGNRSANGSQNVCNGLQHVGPPGWFLLSCMSSRTLLCSLCLSRAPRPTAKT